LDIVLALSGQGRMGMDKAARFCKLQHHSAQTVSDPHQVESTPANTGINLVGVVCIV